MKSTSARRLRDAPVALRLWLALGRSFALGPFFSEIFASRPRRWSSGALWACRPSGRCGIVCGIIYFISRGIIPYQPQRQETPQTPYLLGLRRICYGATDWDRTSNLRLRRPTLYPIELQSRGNLRGIIPKTGSCCRVYLTRFIAPNLQT